MHGVVGSGNPVMLELRTVRGVGLLTFRASSVRRCCTSDVYLRTCRRVTWLEDEKTLNVRYSVVALDTDRSRHRFRYAVATDFSFKRITCTVGDVFYVFAIRSIHRRVVASSIVETKRIRGIGLVSYAERALRDNSKFGNPVANLSVTRENGVDNNVED